MTSKRGRFIFYSYLQDAILLGITNKTYIRENRTIKS